METFIEERLAICKGCPLYLQQNDGFGPICNPRKYLSPDGTKVSWFEKPGWKKGCGCRINMKIGKKNASCVAGKW